MGIVQLTGWTLKYVMEDISIGALNTLLDTAEVEKPKGLLAGADLDVAKLKGMGLKVMTKGKG